MGEFFQKRMLKLKRRHPKLIKRSGPRPHARHELAFPGKPVVSRMLERGYLINCTHNTTLRFLPPYIIGSRRFEHAVRVGRLDRG
jgi:acetylornithine/succinyldiaminopimelate/putrescine aminotransferase